MEKITYLVTNYNNEKYIDDCIQSIVNQKNPNWNCLIVDDASQDKSIEYVEPYLSDRIRLIKNNANLGQIKSLNILIDSANTDIVCIIDSDDALDPSATNEVIKAFNTSSRVGFVYSNCIEYDESLSKPLSVGLTQKIPFGSTSSIVNGHVSSFRCFRKSVFKKTEGYDYSLLYAEDLDLGYKLEEVCLPYYVNKCLYKYRRVNNSRGRNIANKLIGYNSRKIAKLNALDRRGVRGFLRTLCILYINFEYKKCVYSKTNRKVGKYIFRIANIGLRKIINRIVFRVISR